MLGFLLALSACLPVEGDRILIGDLSAALPAFASADRDESIGFAPAPGVERRFSAGELNRLAARKGVAGEIEPVCFERKLTALTKEQVLTAIEASLPEGAQLELIDFSAARIPKGPIEFPASGLTPPRPGSPRDPTIWRGRVIYGTARSLSIWAKARVWTSRPGVVAVIALPADRPIGRSEIRMENIDSPPFAHRAPLSIDQVEGMIPRRPIRAGEVITLAALSEPNDVTRGDTVGIETRAGAAVVKFQVRAETSGRAGETIRVRNVDSGKSFQARVLRKGWVGVE